MEKKKRKRNFVFSDDYHVARRVYQKKYDDECRAIMAELGIGWREATVIRKKRLQERKKLEWAEKVKQWREEDKKLDQKE